MGAETGQPILSPTIADYTAIASPQQRAQTATGADIGKARHKMFDIGKARHMIVDIVDSGHRLFDSRKIHMGRLSDMAIVHDRT